MSPLSAATPLYDPPRAAVAEAWVPGRCSVTASGRTQPQAVTHSVTNQTLKVQAWSSQARTLPATVRPAGQPGAGTPIRGDYIMKLRARDLTWREIDGDVVLLDLRSSSYLTANSSGTVLIKQLTEERTDGELVRSLMEAFGIDHAQAEQDVRTFLGALDQNGLLEPSGSDSQS
jgi:hypothetical protein